MMRRGTEAASRSDTMSSSLRAVHHSHNSVGEGRGEARIGFGDFAAYPAADQRQYFGLGRGRERHLVRTIEFKAGLVADFLDAVFRVHAFQAEAPLLLVERKPSQPREQAIRAARSKDPGRAHARRADEIDLGHQHPPRMLLAE